jgi:hypothetical protein
LALEDLEFFVRELVRSGKKTTVQVIHTNQCGACPYHPSDLSCRLKVVEEVARTSAWDRPYQQPLYDIIFDALRRPAALQLALCLAQVEKSAQVYAGIALFRCVHGI